MKYFLLVTMLGVALSAFSQVKIDTKKDQCKHCNMYIKNQQFAAVALNEKNTHKFDAIECLVNFLKENKESDFTRLLVADYSRQGQLIDAKTATFLKSENIASPMGAYLSAYADLETAQKVRADKGGELFTWAELKERFKDSSFGLLDHPTHHHDRPDAYAPIGVMGDHLHHKGGFMLSVRYMKMDMEGNLQGTNEIENMMIFQNYMVAPQSMQMDMLMIGAMFAPSDKLTIMVMQNVLKNSMDLSTMMGMDFTTESNGIGDLKLSALYGLMSRQNYSIHLNTKMSFPLGSIDNRDNTPMTENMQLPYPMQLGSGTFDLTAGATYKGTFNKVGWGVQQLNTFRTRENDRGYQLGNQYELNIWASYRLTSWVSVSTRFHGLQVGEIDGSDSELNPMMAPPANVMNSGFTRVRSYWGANFSFGDREVFRKIKMGLEYGIPVLQDVNGTQMKDNSYFNVGLRYSI